MIYTEARNAEGGESAKHKDAKIRVQKCLAALDNSSTLTKQFHRAHYSYNNDLTVDLRQ